MNRFGNLLQSNADAEERNRTRRRNERQGLRRAARDQSVARIRRSYSSESQGSVTSVEGDAGRDLLAAAMEITQGPYQNGDGLDLEIPDGMDHSPDPNDPMDQELSVAIAELESLLREIQLTSR